MSAGVSHQYNGRHRQVENSQVGVFLAYAKDYTWTWVDGELYFPENGSVRDGPNSARKRLSQRSSVTRRKPSWVGK